MATISNGESGSSVRTKLNEIINKVEGVTSIDNDITFGDNDKAIFGAGSDLQIYHDGDNSYIDDVGTGQLRIRATNLEITNRLGTENMIIATDGGSVSLRYAGSGRLATTSTGVDITGTLTSDGLTVAPDANRALSLTTDGTYSLILENTSTNSGADLTFKSKDDIIIKCNDLNTLRASAGGNISFYEATGTTPKFFWDASAESLGIGTTSPAHELEIAAVAPILRLTDTDTTAGSGQELGKIEFYTNDADGAHVGADIACYSDDSLGRVNGLTFSVSKTNFADATEAMRIDSSGNVGIGTSSPSAAGSGYGALDVRGAAGGGIRYGVDGGFNMLTYATGSATDFYASAASNIRFFNQGNSTASMIIDSSGNVGIGTSSPRNASGFVGLTLDDASGSFVDFNDSGVRVLTISGNATGNDINTVTAIPMRFKTNNTERMRIDSSGNVIVKAGKELRVNRPDDATYGAISHGASGTGIVYNDLNGDGHHWQFAGSEKMRIDSSGNLLIGGTVTPTSSAKNLVLHNGTAPTGSATDGVILYAEDVSSSSELKVRDEAGNVTTLSPHNFDLIPEGPSEDMAWSYYSERDGKRINVDMLKAIRLLEQISGEKLVHMV